MDGESSDSDFYGDENIVTQLEDRVNDFDAREWLQEHHDTAFAGPRPAKRPLLDASKLHNPYAGVPYAWQLTETVDAFLARLPPATTEATEERPWIFVCNPYIPRREKALAQNQNVSGNEDEGPEEEGTQLHRLIEGGTERLQLLRKFMDRANKLSKAKSTIARDIAKERRQAVSDILSLAHACKVRAGKWMLFCQPEEVNEVWDIVAKATANNELGIAAKVAPRSDDTGRKERLICVYTSDFKDEDDVARVLRRLRELRLLEAMKRGIYYKPDAFTYIGIASGNVWEIKASLYNSFDMLKSS